MFRQGNFPEGQPVRYRHEQKVEAEGSGSERGHRRLRLPHRHLPDDPALIQGLPYPDGRRRRQLEQQR